MKRKYWRDVAFFAAGTFLGGWVLSVIGRLYRKVGG